MVENVQKLHYHVNFAKISIWVKNRRKLDLVQTLHGQSDLHIMSRWVVVVVEIAIVYLLETIDFSKIPKYAFFARFRPFTRAELPM